MKPKRSPTTTASTSRKVNIPPVFDPRLRYSVPVAAAFLGQSVSQTWVDIKDTKLAVIREGKRTFVPGSEIARRSSLSL